MWIGAALVTFLLRKERKHILRKVVFKQKVIRTMDNIQKLNNRFKCKFVSKFSVHIPGKCQQPAARYSLWYVLFVK
jgi:hypothetical protein